MVTPYTDVHAGVKARTPLPNDDVAGNDLLATENFDAEAFALRVTAIPGTAACFLMCHSEKSLLFY